MSETEARFIKGTLIVTLVAALLLAVTLPMSAWAAPKNGAVKAPKANASHKPAAAARKLDRRSGRHKELKDRIAKTLTNRARGFEQAASSIGTRIDRVAAFAVTVGAAGGDVSGVNETLDQARAALADARAAEALAAEMFKAVPDAASRKTSFAAAKAQARTARADLVNARTLLRGAILKLESIVTGLAGAAQ